MWSRCFLPEVDDNVKVLVLGSMPGAKSLQAGEYYAHPRNAFWPLMQNLFAIPVQLDYSLRLKQLHKLGIGLWDVYAECYREGSLDNAIARQTAIVNDFSALLAQYPHIHTVCFNGQAACRAFHQHVLPLLNHSCIMYVSLPSTSPANAALSFEQKLGKWQLIKERLKNV